MEHFRDEMWAASYFRCGAATATQAEIVDQCHAELRRTVASYQPASQPADKVRELERILQRARRELVG
jgi:hypothetical protein